MSDEKLPLHPFHEDEVRLSMINYEAQEWLTRELHVAFELSGLTVEDLARQLELDVDEAELWLSGDHDHTMSDLRHFATALDAHVTYRVEPMMNRLPRWLSGMKGDAWADKSWATERALTWKK